MEEKLFQFSQKVLILSEDIWQRREAHTAFLGRQIWTVFLTGSGSFSNLLFDSWLCAPAPKQASGAIRRSSDERAYLYYHMSFGKRRVLRETGLT